MKYKNTAVVKTEDWSGRPLRNEQYGYSNRSEFLYMWGGLIQQGVAQCGTKLLTGNWLKRARDYAIFKSEGGCRIEGRGDLVLDVCSCYFDYGGGKEDEEAKLAAMITAVVLAFDPMDPIDSIINAFAKAIGVEYDEVYQALVDSNGGTSAFSGNALSSFFDHNPFATSPLFKIQKYVIWARVNIMKEDLKEVKLEISYDNLGKKLLEDMQIAMRAANESDRYLSTPMCCSPRQSKDGTWKFWINTGTTTCIDGWQSEKNIKAFIKRVKKEGLQFYIDSKK